MIFRTGSVLIVGNCEEDVLYIIYEFLKKLLIVENKIIGIKINENALMKKKKKKKKRKRQIVIW